jgi:hypothetical protein
VSIQDERELAERLGGMLDGIEPRPAPLAATIRQGRGIRRRRRITAAAGIAVIVAGAAIIPAVLHSIGAPPPPATHRHRHYTVTVNHLPPQARHGVIASGTQDGHRWQIVMSGSASNSTASGTGTASTSGLTPVGRGGQPQLEGTFGGSTPAMLVGAFSPEVTSVRLVLTGGETLALTPVDWSGHPWIGVELPPGVRLAGGTEYAGSRELGYSVATPDGYGLDNWWRPGQDGPARYTKLIATGRAGGRTWAMKAEIGPWGYCFVGSGTSACMDGLDPIQLHPRTVVTTFVCGNSVLTSGGIDGGLGAAAPQTRQVRVRLSGGGTEVYRTVDVDGTQMFTYVMPKGQPITGASAYDARGHLIGTVGADTMICDER